MVNRPTQPHCIKLEFNTWFLENGKGASTPIIDKNATLPAPQEKPIVHNNSLHLMEPKIVRDLKFVYPSSWTPFSFC